MFNLTKQLKEKYSPMYFLAALGAGGLAVSFFMYLMFMTPHADTPVPTFGSVIAVFQSGNVWMMLITIAALIGIIFFSVLHYRLLAWNISEYQHYKKTDAFKALITSNAEVQLMAIPLTYAMSINIAFIIGAVFVPGLWSVVEFLFPAALLGFAAVGVYALKIYGDFFGRLLTQGGFDCAKNNSLSQMLAVFAFAMVGVGFSAAGAMSHTTVTPGIGFYRIIMGLHHNFDLPTSNAGVLVMFSIFGSIQVLFGLLGYRVMKDTAYFQRFIHGEDKSAVAYALICPGVAGTVMSFFFLHKGLVASGIVGMFSLPYFVLLVPVVYLQYLTIKVLLRLNDKMLTGKPTPVLKPAT